MPNQDRTQTELEQRVATHTEALQAALLELAGSRDQALQASRMKSDFLANMSHEIRTPLNGIVGATDLLMEMAENREQLDLLNTLKISSETLLDLINNILDFAKIEQGQLQLEQRNFSIEEVCDSVLELFTSIAEDKKIALHAYYQPRPMPAFIGDPARLRQLLSNLVSNALKFTSEGSVELQLSCSPESGRGLVIKVQDSGIGIAKDQQRGLFEAFSRGADKNQAGGSGLGLAICSQLANLMHGSIKVDSEEGAGACFTVELPLVHAEQGDNSAKQNQQADFQLDNKLWVLLVDDNLINRQVGTRLLESLKCSVAIVESGAEAIQACKENAFDLVLMDIEMPEMDGIEAMKSIRELKGKTPALVALTAHALQGDRERYLNSGFDDYLEKPLKKNRLWETLAEFCSADSKVEAEAENMDNSFGQKSILNTRAHSEFVELMGDEYTGLAARYRNDITESCAEILRQIETDFAAVKKTAHRLKSSSGYLGAERMHAILEWLEHEAEQQSPAERLAVAVMATEVANETCEALLQASS